MTLPLPLKQAPRVLIVAELSANHGGSLERALETIRAAAEAGADAIKIQTYTADTITIDSDQPGFRIQGGPWDGRRLHDLYEEAHTPWAWHPQLKQAAAAAGLPLFSSPFDPTAVAFLEALGVPAYKIASFELVDLELIAQVAATRRPLIMSTGMASEAEIAAAVETVREVWGEDDPGLALLHCVSSYPASPDQMCLATIADLGRRFGVIPGLSDHTLGTAVAVAAVALGARVIEKHVCLRRADGGPDSGFSLEPAELQQLVEAVRVAERAVGEVRYGPVGAEVESLAFRRSLYAVEDVARGERFSRENVRSIRPGHGLPPSWLTRVLGKVATADVPRGTPLREELLGEG